jgi:hypothetical protein
MDAVVIGSLLSVVGAILVVVVLAVRIGRQINKPGSGDR